MAIDLMEWMYVQLQWIRSKEQLLVGIFFTNNPDCIEKVLHIKYDKKKFENQKYKISFYLHILLFNSFMGALMQLSYRCLHSWVQTAREQLKECFCN